MMTQDLDNDNQWPITGDQSAFRPASGRSPTTSRVYHARCYAVHDQLNTVRDVSITRRQHENLNYMQCTLLNEARQKK